MGKAIAIVLALLALILLATGFYALRSDKNREQMINSFKKGYEEGSGKKKEAPVTPQSYAFPKTLADLRIFVTIPTPAIYLRIPDPKINVVIPKNNPTPTVTVVRPTPIIRITRPRPTIIIESSSVTGEASWYGRNGCLGCSPDLHMANGQDLDDSAMTIAYMRVPLGTLVKVTNTQTGAAVNATVTDRGGFEALGRIADLTPAVRDAIGCGSVCQVTVSPL